MRLRRGQRTVQGVAVFVSCTALGAAAAFSQELLPPWHGLPLHFDKPPGWTLVSADTSHALFLADEDAKVTLSSVRVEKAALDWAIGEVEVLKSTTVKPRNHREHATLSGCRITEAPKAIVLDGRPAATLSADCTLAEGHRVVQLRLVEYAWNEAGWLVVAKLENVAHRLGSAARTQFQEVLQSVHVNAAAAPRAPAAAPIRPAATALNEAPRLQPRPATYSNEIFGIAWSTPSGWRNLYRADAQSPLPEGLLSLHEKVYDGAVASRRFPSTIVLRVWDQDIPGTSLAEEFATVMGAIDARAITAGPAQTALGGRPWMTGEFQQKVDAASRAASLKSKVYMTLQQDRRGLDLVILVKGTALADEFAQDVASFDATVGSMNFRTAEREKRSLLRSAIRVLFGPPASESGAR
jgi:hypothetical protein